MTEPEITERMLPKFSIRRPVTVTMILSAILVVGFIAYTRIKLDLIPAGLNPPFLGVWVPYQDANPKEIEEQIVKPVEGEMKTVNNLKRVFSYSSSQGCWFWLEFSQGTNMDLAYAQASDRLERARPYLPSEIEYFYIRRFRSNDDPVMYMGISYDPSVVDPYYVTERHIKMPLEGIKGVANSELFGLREKYIQIIVDTDRVKTYNINLYELMQRLMRDNFAMSHGYVYVGKRKYLLRSKSRFSSLDDIRNIEIGHGVRLKNIADVVYDFDEEIDSLMRVDGKIAAGLAIYKESEANTVEVCQNLLAELKKQFREQPDLNGVQYFVFFDQGNMIEESIGNVQTTMLWGAIFAFFVLFFFLHRFRITLMLTLAIPLSLLVSVMLIYGLDWTLNGFTMMGLMISIGLVVDNSIVITENIYRFNGMGYDTKRAAVLGASEVGLAIVMATLTTIVVFLPLMVMGGNMFLTFYLTRIGLPVIFALLASLFIALILIPLGTTKTIPKDVKVIHSTHNVVVQKYQDFLVKILKNRVNALIIVLVVIFSVAYPISHIKKTDVAESGIRDAKVICDFPSNTNLEKVDKTLNYIAEKIMEKNDIYHIDHISTRVRQFNGRVDIYMKPDPDKQWYQVIYRKISNMLGLNKYRRLTREELTEDIKKDLPVIPGVKMRTTWDEQQGATDSSLTYTLYGYDTEVLNSLADELEKQIKLVPNVLTVETDAETGNDEIHIVVDREKAYNIGVSPFYLSQLIRFNLSKRKISNYQAPEKEIEIYVKTRPDQRETVAQLKNTFIATDKNSGTNLSSLADLTYHRSLGRIRRENGKSSMEIKIYSTEADMKTISSQLDTIFKNFRYPTGYSYGKGSRSRQFENVFEDLDKALLFSIVFVFLIMGVLFESFILPLTVLIAIPAAFVGSYWLLYITGTTFEIFAGIGLVVLIGVVVNNAIVLIDLINQYRKSGMGREQAILVAAMHRFRPILMTALTTIFGLFPMAVGNTGLIGMPYAPMGITLIGGLISSTFLTLFAVPLFYTYFDDLRQFFPNFIRKFF
jgi:HAE1 family hydrophobic/amphiphilic exporter-1